MRKEWLNPKILILFIVLALTIIKVHANNVSTTSQKFNLFCSNVGFQHYQDRWITLSCLTGILNSSIASLTSNSRTGTLTFTNNESATVQIAYSDVLKVSVEGDSDNAARLVDNQTILTFQPTNNIVIQWSNKIESPWDTLTMPIFGFTGLGLSGFSVMYLARKLRNGLHGPSDLRDIALLMVFIIIGVGLLISWLW